MLHLYLLKDRFPGKLTLRLRLALRVLIRECPWG